MAEIAPLTPQVIEQLCAGEVVERPASIVKELIENAIDAGATEITIELRDGGRAGVTVTDNGSGIEYNQMPNAVKPHYTSKLKSLDDLYKLRTMGFRGEALGAIAAVSRLHLTSRTVNSDNAGELYIEAGQLQYHRPAAFNVGTRIEVRDVFYNIPVRRKFLKAKRTESANSITRIIDYSIIHPHIAFKLFTEGVQEYQSSGSNDIKAILSESFGASVIPELIEFDHEHNGYRAQGFISAPHVHQNHRNFQKIFINQRPARNGAVTKAVTDSSLEFMTPGKYPYLCLFLTIPPDMIDVNVHPTKAEVALSDTGAVYYIISMALKKALDNKLSSKLGKVIIKSQPQNKIGEKQEKNFEMKSADANTTRKIVFHPVSASESESQLHQSRLSSSYSTQQKRTTTLDHSLPSSSFNGPDAIPIPHAISTSRSSLETAKIIDKTVDRAVETEQNSWELIRQSEVKLLGQIASSYIAFVAGSELFLVDQHAAHERVLFGKLWRDYENGKLMKASQDLMFPYMLSVTPEIAHITKELQPLLAKLGFSISSGGVNTILVKSIPSLLAAVISEQVVHETIAEVANELKQGLEKNTVPEAITKRIKLICATLACKAAVKAGTTLNPPQQRALLEELMQPEVGTTCPHGRPVLVIITEQEISKLFLRS